MKLTKKLKIDANIFFLAIVLPLFQNCGGFVALDEADQYSFASSSGISFKSEVGRRVKETLVKKCATCHGAANSSSGGITNITDPRILAQKKLIVLGRPDLSPLYQQVASGRMPTTHPLNKVEIDDFRIWILGQTTVAGDGCTAMEEEVKVPTKRRIWRLTNTQYLNTIRDLFATSFDPTTDFSDDPRNGGINNNSDNLQIDAGRAFKYRSAAATISKLVLDGANNNYPMIRKYWPDASVNVQSQSEVSAFIDNIGLQVYRRPLSASEKQTLVNVYQIAKSPEGFDGHAGVGLVIEVLLQSPHFLYRSELGAEKTAGIYQLTDFEIASLLSYSLWDTTPDDELLGIAKTNTLANPEIMHEQIDRLLADNRSHRLFPDFVTEWFNLKSLKDRSIPITQSDTTNAKVGGYMLEEVRSFVDSVVYQDDGQLATLFTSNQNFVNGVTGKIYGLAENASTELVPVRLDPKERSGLLTMSGVMTNLTGVLPIVRGLLVRKELFCQTLPGPPANLGDFDDKKDLGPDTTIADRLAQHTTNISCKGCHAMMDPIGLGFSKYNSFGEFSAITKTGKPIVAKGEVSFAIEGEGPYDGAVELSRKIASSDDLKSCMNEKFYTYLFGKEVQTGDRCEMSRARRKLAGSQRDGLIEMLKSYLGSDALILRSVEN